MILVAQSYYGTLLLIQNHLVQFILTRIRFLSRFVAVF